MTRIPFTLIVGFLLAGCAAKGEFPSLAPRPYEQGRQAASPPVAPAVPASDAARLARIEAAVQRAEAGRADFDSALANARAAVARGTGGFGTEGWIAAQMAVSRAERTREPVQAALADLDTEMRKLLMQAPSADRAVLDAAMARLNALDAEQSGALAALARGLSAR